MNFMDVASSKLLYVLVGIVILYVVGFAILFGVKSYKRAIVIGFTKKQLNEVIRSSAVFGIVPSLAIVIGLFSLVGLLGIPWPWLRLSVIGSVTYELMAADTVMKTMGITDVMNASGEAFGVTMYVMTIGILFGMLLVVFTTEKIQAGTIKLKNKDKRWGALGMSTFMTTILVVFMVPIMLKGGVYLLTLLTSAVIAVVLGVIAKKFKLHWLNGFILAFCLLGAMASSVLWTGIIG